MTETEFHQITEALFLHIEKTLEAYDIDADSLINGNVLEIEFPNTNKIVVNRHVHNQEVWIATRQGGYHFSYQSGRWVTLRDQMELFSILQKAIQEESGCILRFS